MEGREETWRGRRGGEGRGGRFHVVFFATSLSVAWRTKGGMTSGCTHPLVLRFDSASRSRVFGFDLSHFLHFFPIFCVCVCLATQTCSPGAERCHSSSPLRSVVVRWRLALLFCVKSSGRITRCCLASSPLVTPFAPLPPENYYQNRGAGSSGDNEAEDMIVMPEAAEETGSDWVTGVLDEDIMAGVDLGEDGEDDGDEDGEDYAQGVWCCCCSSC